MNKPITKNPEPPDELLECFDNDGKIIQTRTRNELHIKPYSIWHGVSCIWIINRKKEILCSKRSETLSGNPGKWQTYFGGHVKSGSSFLKTAQDELFEEVGLKLPLSDFKLVIRGKREDVMHIYEMYEVLFDRELSDLNFMDGEITEVKWFSFDSYQESKTLHADNWCNSMNQEQYNIICNLNL